MEQTLRTRIKQRHGTNAYWSSQLDFIPLNGELIFYDDHKTFTDENDIVHNIAGIKFGDGVTAVGALPFLSDEMEKQILAHIADTNVHLQKGEREDWDSKVSADVQGEIAIFD